MHPSKNLRRTNPAGARWPVCLREWRCCGYGGDSPDITGARANSATKTSGENRRAGTECGDGEPGSSWCNPVASPAGWTTDDGPATNRRRSYRNIREKKPRSAGIGNFPADGPCDPKSNCRGAQRDADLLKSDDGAKSFTAILEMEVRGAAYGQTLWRSGFAANSRVSSG